MDRLKIEYVRVEELKPYPDSPREMVRDYCKRSIQRFGFLVPLIVNKDNEVISGNIRLKAAQELGLEELPCIRVDLDKDAEQAFRLVDNRVKQVSNWDWCQLDKELRKLSKGIEEFGLVPDQFQNVNIDRLFQSDKRQFLNLTD